MANPIKIGNINSNIDNNLVNIWQYDQSPKIKKIIDNDDAFAKNYVGKFWHDYAEDIFSIKTANTFGLELWGEILGVERPDYEINNVKRPFSDDMYRKLLLGRVMKLNCNGSVKEINDYLQFIFEGKYAVAKNNYDMTMNIIVYQGITYYDNAVLQADGFLPIPVGVQVGYSTIDSAGIFGFDGSGLNTFDNGTFFGGFVADDNN